MRAAVLTDVGSTDNIEVREVDDPEPGAGEALVTVHACGLNHSDLWTVESDSAAGIDLPYTPGSDVAGVVEATGDGVTGLDPGDRVVLCPNRTCGSCRYCREGPENRCGEYGIWTGGFADRVAVPADRLVELPDGVSFAAAATLPISAVTAWHMLQQAGVTAGDRVLVPGATGGVGVVAVQLADVMGVETVGSSRSAAKLERVPALDHGVVTDDPDELRERVAEVGPVDAVVDHLGGPFTAMGLRAVRRGGTVVTCGRTTGSESTVDVGDLFWEHKRLQGSTMGTQADLERLVDVVAAGDLEPVVAGRYDLAETRAAFEDMRDRDLVGTAVVEPA